MYDFAVNVDGFVVVLALSRHGKLKNLNYGRNTVMRPCFCTIVFACFSFTHLLQCYTWSLLHFLLCQGAFPYPPEEKGIICNNFVEWISYTLIFCMMLMLKLLQVLGLLQIIFRDCSNKRYLLWCLFYWCYLAAIRKGLGWLSAGYPI